MNSALSWIFKHRNIIVIVAIINTRTVPKANFDRHRNFYRLLRLARTRAALSKVKRLRRGRVVKAIPPSFAKPFLTFPRLWLRPDLLTAVCRSGMHARVTRAPQSRATVPALPVRDGDRPKEKVVSPSWSILIGRNIDYKKTNLWNLFKD